MGSSGINAAAYGPASIIEHSKHDRTQVRNFAFRTVFAVHACVFDIFAAVASVTHVFSTASQPLLQFLIEVTILATTLHLPFCAWGYAEFGLLSDLVPALQWAGSPLATRLTRVAHQTRARPRARSIRY